MLFISCSHGCALILELLQCCRLFVSLRLHLFGGYMLDTCVCLRAAALGIKLNKIAINIFRVWINGRCPNLPQLGMQEFGSPPFCAKLGAGAAPG